MPDCVVKVRNFFKNSLDFLFWLCACSSSKAALGTELFTRVKHFVYKILNFPTTPPPPPIVHTSILSLTSCSPPLLLGYLLKFLTQFYNFNICTGMTFSSRILIQNVLKYCWTAFYLYQEIFTGVSFEDARMKKNLHWDISVFLMELLS